MYKKKKFTTALEAIKYIKTKQIAPKRLIYIASRNGKCELVYKRV